MSPARNNFLNRLASFRKAVSATALVDQGITSEASTLTEAVLLRNGMAVVGFAMLEDFIKARAEEVSHGVKPNGRRFSELPERLQRATTINALKGIMAKARLIEDEGADSIAFVQAAAEAVSSTAKKTYKLSSFSLPSDRSNLTPDLIKDYLASFMVKDAWAQMDSIASRIGYALPSTRDVFVAAAKRRHRAAHSVSAEVPLGDLQQFADQATTIAIAFDVLVTHAARSIFSSRYVPGDDRYAVKAEDVELFFVDEKRAGSWSVIQEGKKRATFTSSSVDAARKNALKLCKSRMGVSIVRSHARKPMEWFTA